MFAESGVDDRRGREGNVRAAARSIARNFGLPVVTDPLSPSSERHVDALSRNSMNFTFQAAGLSRSDRPWRSRAFARYGITIVGYVENRNKRSASGNGDGHPSTPRSDRYGISPAHSCADCHPRPWAVLAGRMGCSCDASGRGSGETSRDRRCKLETQRHRGLLPRVASRLGSAGRRSACSVLAPGVRHAAPCCLELRTVVVGASSAASVFRAAHPCCRAG